MKTYLLAATLMAGFLALGNAALADDGQTAAASTQVAQSSSAAPCTAAKDPPVPLGIVLKGTAIIQSPDPGYLYGASMRGSCVGTKYFVPSTQPFNTTYPFPAYRWTSNTLDNFIGKQFYGTL